ncbi:outer membrane protein, partial [Salmonella enterica]|uniref:outer membrane protein n=1 Tax=Salmonella enterica TaxID=28901 RepID=UPI001F48ACD8
ALSALSKSKGWDMCHSFLIVYYWNDTEFLTLPGYKVGDADYTSLLVGPSYRFNDYLNAYVMIGAANGHIKDNWGNSDNKTAFAYGAGIQLNPVENIAVNASYEHTSFSTDADSDVKAGT